MVKKEEINVVMDKSLKLISLNTWGGQLFDDLMGFVKNRRDETDIFCFQEIPMGERAVFTAEHGIRENLFAELKTVLPDFQPLNYIATAGGKFDSKEIDFPFGTATFVRKNLKVGEHGGFQTYSESGFFAKSEKRTPTGTFFYAEVGNYLVCNIHGIILREIGKDDTPDRLEQSKRIIDFLAARHDSPQAGRGGKQILCGDFNLKPQTESIAMLGRVMRNLIKDYGIESTRTELYRNMEKWQDPIADYVFVSPDIKVRDFKVLGDVVSDHSPLYVEFS
ncbi:MAG: endonuclease/exonuclease/phosphatase family protein [Patescibacteria group bacterium]